MTKGSYSSVVKKKEHYEELIRRMQRQNENMQRTVQNGQGKIERIMTIRNDGEYQQLIGKRLHQIVDQCLQIDVSAAAMGQMKRQKVDDDMAVQRQSEMRSTQVMSSSSEAGGQRQYGMDSTKFLQNHQVKIDQDR